VILFAGPVAALKILDVARREFPISKSIYLLMAQEEVAFWQALRQGCVHAARARAAAMCSLPHHAGAVEIELRCVHCIAWTFPVTWTEILLASHKSLKQGRLVSSASLPLWRREEEAFSSNTNAMDSCWGVCRRSCWSL
jgi:hypothetical protein